MNSAVKLAAFAAVVAAIFGGAMAVGAAVGPIDVGGGGGTHITGDMTTTTTVHVVDGSGSDMTPIQHGTP